MKKMEIKIFGLFLLFIVTCVSFSTMANLLLESYGYKILSIFIPILLYVTYSLYYHVIAFLLYEELQERHEHLIKFIESKEITQNDLEMELFIMKSNPYS